jgi:hypothetical protein
MEPSGPVQACVCITAPVVGYYIIKRNNYGINLKITESVINT